MAPYLLVRRPPTSLDQGILSHIEDRRDSIDYKSALLQWKQYTQVYRERGWDVRIVDQDDSLPDSVFVEDAVVFVGSADGEAEGIFVVASPGNAAREAETQAVEFLLAKDTSSQHSVARIEKPGTLDGGDVLKVPSQRIIYVGQSQRTNDDGIRQLAELVTPLGWQVQRVPVKKALHLKSMITALPDGTVIGSEHLVEDTSVFSSFLAMPEPEGAAVVFLETDPLSAKTLLISSSAPKSATLLRQKGYSVVETPVSEFEKLEGCVTCLSVRVRT